ncbi:hypothetical protein BU16DRAFT_536551 [Lophium mytilinum]|uniref:Uncharacterized protein n=1 Tax=Lophium mytilinum TaxID=390894 RepID=A0A6A6R1W4_9PEZI|nr:hypothetical protein BU16DRAFT_536551 [Lophium mytilinum]
MPKPVAHGAPGEQRGLQGLKGTTGMADGERARRSSGDGRQPGPGTGTSVLRVVVTAAPSSPQSAQHAALHADSRSRLHVAASYGLSRREGLRSTTAVLLVLFAITGEVAQQRASVLGTPALSQIMQCARRRRVSRSTVAAIGRHRPKSPISRHASEGDDGPAISRPWRDEENAEAGLTAARSLTPRSMTTDPDDAWTRPKQDERVRVVAAHGFGVPSAWWLVESEAQPSFSRAFGDDDLTRRDSDPPPCPQ